MVPDRVRRALASLPRAPGVYLMRDASGEVIYVGKALRLNERVRSYFQPYHQKADHKVFMIAQTVRDLETIVTRSEMEALVLEEQLIKSHRPRFNVRLKDDKRFPYLKVTLGEPFPRLLVSRRVERDGAKYFGPYTNAQLVRENLNTLRRFYPARTCADDIRDRPTRARPCLDHFIRQCPAPCVQKIERDAYRKRVEALCRFLEGRDRTLFHEIEVDMAQASEALRFERAAHLRDALGALKALAGQHRAVSTGTLTSRDAVGLASSEGTCAVQVFFVRDGAIKGREHFFLDVPQGSSPGEVLGAFLTQFYAEATVIPREVLLPESMPELEWIQTWLSDKLGGAVKLLVPQRGPKRKLVQMATRNAELALFESVNREARAGRRRRALEELREALDLPRLPERIECYDISNLHGGDAVGAMVVFEDGSPHKADYRRFRIKTVRGADDFAMMAETLRRRFQHGLRERAELGDLDRNASRGDGTIPAVKFAKFPDLILIDGGKGQLGAARHVLQELNLTDIPLAALAKKREEIFQPKRKDPVLLPRESEALYLVQHLRDEAHRFGVRYHRSLRQRHTVHSALDEVPGVGPKRRTQLLRHFGSVSRIRAASLEEIEAVPGISARVARQVHAALRVEDLSKNA